MNDPPVVDAHIHFWDPGRLHYAWLDAEPRLRRPFGPADLDTGSVPVGALVVVEADRRPSESLAEVEWALSLRSPTRPIAGVVASAALELPSADDELAALSRHPQVGGVRRVLQNCRPGFSAEPGFVRAVRSLAGLGLVFDLCVRHHQLAEATVLAKQCPEATFVLDHLGKPRVRPFPERSWVVDVERLAALPNTRCKLSGLTSEVLDPVGTPAGSDLFRPYLDHALQTFGPSRCLFGSDWPVASLHVTYEGWFDHVMAALATMSPGDIAQVLHRTATRVYRLAGQPGSPYSPDSPARYDAKVPTEPEREGRGDGTWR